MSVVGNGNNWECMKHGIIAERDPESTLSWASFPPCPKCQEVIEKKLCVECEERPSAITYSDSQMSYIHGFVQNICNRCYFLKVEAILVDVQNNYNNLLKTLTKDERGEMDRLVGDENSWNKAFRYYRAGGDCVCTKCGQTYYDHPVVRGPERWHYQCELHVLCNTDRVKL